MTSPGDREDSPVRVLWVIARMNVGGPALLASLFTEHLDGHRFITRLVCGQVEPAEGDYLRLRQLDLPIREIPSLGRSIRLGGDFSAFFALWREIRDFRPDIVHTHTAKAGVLGRLAACLARVPVRVHTYHGHLLHGYFPPLKTKAVRVLESILGRFTTSLIAVGEKVRDELVEAGIGRREKFTVIPPGVQLRDVPDRDRCRTELRLPAGSPVVLFTGRLTRVKRPDRLLEAMALVVERVPEAVLLIAGDGELMGPVRVAASPLGDSVRFVGWRADIETLLGAADLAVIASDNEGMPVSLIEAAHAGLPAVATDVGSVAEVVVDGHTGLVVEPTAPAIADALVRLLTDDESREQMGRVAAERAKDRFSVERMVRGHEEIYRRLLPTSNAPGPEDHGG